MKSWPRQSRSVSFTIGINDDVTHLSLSRRSPRPTPRRKAPSSASSGASAATVPSARTRTPSRSSATTPIKYVQAYFQYDSKKTGGVTDLAPPLRRQAHQEPVLHQQGRLRRLPQPVLHHQGLSRSSTTSSRAACSSSTASGIWPSWSIICQCGREALHRKEQHSASTPSTPLTLPSRSAWASAPTPSCSPPSSRWPRSCPMADAIKYMKDAGRAFLRQEGRWTVVEQELERHRRRRRPPTSRSTFPPAWATAEDKADEHRAGGQAGACQDGQEHPPAPSTRWTAIPCLFLPS